MGTRTATCLLSATALKAARTVSYTHLDVYKRQDYDAYFLANCRSFIGEMLPDKATEKQYKMCIRDSCIDVIYHNNMKAFGLQQLIKLYLQWLSQQTIIEEEENK